MQFVLKRALGFVGVIDQRLNTLVKFHGQGDRHQPCYPQIVLSKIDCPKLEKFEEEGGGVSVVVEGMESYCKLLLFDRASARHTASFGVKHLTGLYGEGLIE
mgnify:FL=1